MLNQRVAHRQYSSAPRLGALWRWDICRDLVPRFGVEIGADGEVAGVIDKDCVQTKKPIAQVIMACVSVARKNSMAVHTASLKKTKVKVSLPVRA